MLSVNDSLSFGYYLVVNDIMHFGFIWYVIDLKYKTTNRVGDLSKERLTKTEIILSY